MTFENQEAGFGLDSAPQPEAGTGPTPQDTAPRPSSTMPLFHETGPFKALVQRVDANLRTMGDQFGQRELANAVSHMLANAVTHGVVAHPELSAGHPHTAAQQSALDSATSSFSQAVTDFQMHSEFDEATALHLQALLTYVQRELAEHKDTLDRASEFSDSPSGTAIFAHLAKGLFGALSPSSLAGVLAKPFEMAHALEKQAVRHNLSALEELAKVLQAHEGDTAWESTEGMEYARKARALWDTTEKTLDDMGGGWTAFGGGKDDVTIGMAQKLDAIRNSFLKTAHNSRSGQFSEALLSMCMRMTQMAERLYERFKSFVVKTINPSSADGVGGGEPPFAGPGGNSLGHFPMPEPEVRDAPYARPSM